MAEMKSDIVETLQKELRSLRETIAKITPPARATNTPNFEGIRDFQVNLIVSQFDLCSMVRKM